MTPEQINQLLTDIHEINTNVDFIACLLIVIMAIMAGATIVKIMVDK